MQCHDDRNTGGMGSAYGARTDEGKRVVEMNDIGARGANESPHFPIGSVGPARSQEKTRLARFAPRMDVAVVHHPCGDSMAIRSQGVKIGSEGRILAPWLGIALMH